MTGGMGSDRHFAWQQSSATTIKPTNAWLIPNVSAAFCTDSTKISLTGALAVLLIVGYGLGLLFSLKTHREVFAGAGCRAIVVSSRKLARGSRNRAPTDVLSPTIASRPGLRGALPVPRP